MKLQKTIVAPPYKYSAWPMLGKFNDKLVCIYTIANMHSATESSLVMKTSEDGISWSEGKEILPEKTKVKGITGTGNDSRGNMLIWYRDGYPGAPDTTHEVYRTDGEDITLISKPEFSFNGAHIGNIFTVADKYLFSFYNTYGPKRSWGVLISSDDGITWEQREIETLVDKSECPVEIDGFYTQDGKIFALGRKDSGDGTVAMFQLRSIDLGKNWSKKYTNITDSLQTSPCIIYDSDTINLYYFHRGTGTLKRRVTRLENIWDSPLSWTEPEILITEPFKGEDTGNVKAVALGDMHFATYYAGTPTTTAILGVTIND